MNRFQLFNPRLRAKKTPRQGGDWECVGLLSSGLDCFWDFWARHQRQISLLRPIPLLQRHVVTYNWTGCHVGGHVGGVVSEYRTTSVFGSSNSFSSTGFAGGGQIGCDYQFAPGWVVGAEGRAAWSSLKNSHAAHVVTATGFRIPAQLTVSNDFLASATARLGYGFADRLLVFVRGGAAWTQEKVDIAFTTLGGTAVDPNASATRTGWTAGTGVEWAFAPHWSTTLEYNYYDFGSHGVLLTSTTNNVFVAIASLKDTIHEATIGVDYHF